MAARAANGNGSQYNTAQVLDLLEDTDFEDMEIEEDSGELDEPVCDGSDDDLGLDIVSGDEKR